MSKRLNIVPSYYKKDKNVPVTEKEPEKNEEEVETKKTFKRYNKSTEVED